jgi:NAD(P)-dependent dehydrogenase (short-subunit alcohol dehydrogenase family)
MLPARCEFAVDQKKGSIMTDWNNSVAFITGGAQGIGLGIAHSLVARGAKVAIADINEDALTAAKADLTERGGTIKTFRLDVRDRAAYADVADRAEAALGPVTLLFNNAGIAPALQLADLTYDTWDIAIGVNLNGVINGLQTFVPRLIERGTGGYVVNTASGAGFISTAGILYTTTKHAVVGLSEALKREAAPYGIDVSVLCPAQVATNIMKNTSTVAGTVKITPDETAETEADLQAGATIDEVGEMVIAGMGRKATWIHTAAFVKPFFQERFDAILASIPAD